jgi:hypothetical protein
MPDPTQDQLSPEDVQALIHTQQQLYASGDARAGKLYNYITQAGYATPDAQGGLQPKQFTTDTSGRTPTGQPQPSDTRNAFQRFADNINTPDPRREEWQSPTQNTAQDFGRHLVAPVLQTLAHPIQSAQAMGSMVANSGGTPEGLVQQMVQPVVQNAVQDYQQHGPVRTATNLAGTGIGTWAGGEIGGAAARGVLKAAPAVVNTMAELADTPEAMATNGSGPFQAVRNAAQGSPDAAALKGLNVSAKSKVALRTIQNTDAARPYLQGVQNLEDLQARIPQAKAEVWGPYQRTIDAIGGKTVEGPEGPTTIAELENQRLQLSAINRGVKSGDPATLQLVQQKGLNQADLIAQEHAVQDALDPHLEQAGIRPQLIRKTFAQISGVGNRTMGRSTISESNTPYGVGKAANLSFTRPLAAPGEVAGGLRDIVAGRPLISGKATDVNIREAFRSGGKKPNLGEFDPRSQVAPISRQLPAQVQPIQLPSSFESLMQLRNGAQ